MRAGVLAAVLVACGDNRAASFDAPVTLEHCTVVRGTDVLLRQIATLPGAPLLVTAPKGDPRQFVVEQDGLIWIIENDVMRARPFLDLGADAGGPVVAGGERGLLGLAFHPRYTSNGTFFVYYTTLTHDIVARYQVTGDPDVADPASGTIVLGIADMFSNHNGGQIDFGGDGYLYIGTGDGGGGGDPLGAGQDAFALLGKLLRIDVDGQAPGKAYGIPPTNPFADGAAGAPEVFMLGIRNPWRWTIDPATGDFWIGDVGQDLQEELHHVPAASARGANLGWNVYEGTSCFRPPCDPAGKLVPQVVRTHGEGWCSIIGGAVYRGDCYPDLAGTYFFSDYCEAVLETARVVGDRVVVRRASPTFQDLVSPARAGFPVTPSSLHADGLGELYLTTVSCCGSSSIGAVYHLEARP